MQFISVIFKSGSDGRWREEKIRRLVLSCYEEELGEGGKCLRKVLRRDRLLPPLEDTPVLNANFTYERDVRQKKIAN